MDRMSLSNIIAFACKRHAGQPAGLPQSYFGAAGPKPGRNPVAWREAPLRRGEAWEQGWAQRWGSCRPRSRPRRRREKVTADNNVSGARAEGLLLCGDRRAKRCPTLGGSSWPR